MEETLVLIKPDAVKSRLIGEILKRYENEALDIMKMRLVLADEKLLTMHYNEHVGRDYFAGLIDFMMSGNIVALVLRGEKAIERVRILNGSTNPEDAAKGSIRGDLAEDLRHNLVHGSDSAASAIREIALWF